MTNAFEQLLPALKAGVFISHITAESPIAVVLEKYIQAAFGKDLPISNQPSFGGGRQWFDYVLNHVRTAKVVLVLVSQESADREWVNFEAGCGAGTGATVIPVAIKQYSFTKLGYPLKGFNGRLLEDIEGILFDISRETGIQALSVDRLEYLREMRMAEDSLTFRNLVIEPVLIAGAGDDSVLLTFTIENRGNVDLDLLLVEVMAPTALLHPNVHRANCPNVLDWDATMIEGESYAVVRFSTTIPPTPTGLISLRPVLTRSMGKLPLSSLKIGLRRSMVSQPDSRLRVFYQAYARNFDSVRDSMLLSEVPEGG